MARILEQVTDISAFVKNGRLDVLTANRLAQALYAPLFADRTRAANDARFHFASATGSRLRRTEPRRGASTVTDALPAR